MTVFHCANRAEGASVAAPDLVYGPYQRDHSLPGSSVLPLRAKNSMWGSFACAALEPAGDLAGETDGGLHHSRRPHCEKRWASKEWDSNLPSRSLSGSTGKTFQGMAV